MEFDEFLREALPPLGYQWRPHRRRGIRRKIQERLHRLHFCRWEDYLHYLRAHEGEQRIFADLLPVTVSRFFRNREYFRFLREKIFPDLIRQNSPAGDKTLRVWSLGAAAGEEAYSIAVCFDHDVSKKFTAWEIRILATDKDENMIARGKEGVYSPGSLREFPKAWRNEYFDFRGGKYYLKDAVKQKVRWRRHDFRMDPPIAGPFHLVFCAYSLFTYYAPELQKLFLEQLDQVLRPGAYLVLGKKENLPASGRAVFRQVDPKLKIYQKPLRSILFVCVGNACRSQMAEGFARHLGSDQFRVFSAGSRPAGFVAPQAVAAMREKGIDLSGHYSKSVQDLGEKFYDVVVTMGCGDECPWVPAGRRFDWPIADPIGQSDQVFARVRDEIEKKVRGLLDLK